ncbi:iron complex transport system ATP-binding protein [Aurantimicrobium minutum]|uniref:ABC transporter ATP-binding protein n=1 Tax=Aurantimicrobium minutum TaxID=708131 RepID=UPI00247503D1|nr:ATP-binding cassette domain-containing protein [Aurantimicrobium minutum]MDH6532589.1 iron complex transport system ATP-binding protein [Aurantimicrobium minutum]
MTNSLLQFSHVTVLRNARPIVSDVSFEVGPSQHWAIVGPNGAGKSTVMSLLAGNTLPSRGQVHIFGHLRGTVEIDKLKNQISYVSTHHGLEWPMTATDIVLTGFTNTLELPMRWEPTKLQREKAVEQLRAHGLEHVMDTTWRALSQGELARVMLAKAAMKEPRLLLLDEPAAGLDITARDHLLRTIDGFVEKHPEMSSVMVTHHLEELPNTTTHILLMKNGAVVASGLTNEILTTEHLSNVFNVNIEVHYDAGRWRATVIR